MRKFFTLAVALIASFAINAQNVDTSGWAVGDDVASQLEWGDYNGKWSGGLSANQNGDSTINDMGMWWKGSKPTEYNNVNGVAAVGFYFDGKTSGELTNLYQVVYFPAGYYTFKVQALYREGTPNDNFTNHFNNVIKKNAWFYADLLSSSDPESEVTTSYQTYVRSLATSEQTDTRIFFDSNGSWKNDYQYKYKVPGTSPAQIVSYYCPQCLPGAIAYFTAGKYENELKVMLTTPGYVRIGFKKTANIAQDWLVFTNIRIIYNGPADDAAKLDLAINQYDVISNSVSEVADNITAKGYEALAAIVGDRLMEIDGEIDKGDNKSIVAGIDKLNALIEEANNALLVAYSLADLIESSHDMLTSTDFSGKATFESEVERIEGTAVTKDPDVINNDPGTFNVLYAELSKARADYLNTGEPDETGAKDFTSLIKYPWFVNPEYTPSIVNGNWQLTAEGWTDGMAPGNYTGIQSPEDGTPKLDIASKVVLSADETVTNQWFKRINYTDGWSAGLNLYYQGHLIGASDGWNTGFIGTMEICQQLVGLPKGYYSLKALVRGNGTSATHTWNDTKLPPYHNIFAINSDSVRVASLPGYTDSFRYSQYGWNEWNPDAWTEHKTGIIAALDGKLMIGGQSSMIANYTGFRLMYYGENPRFDGLVKENIDEVLQLMKTSKVTFAGDTLHVKAILDSIQFPVLSAEAYEATFTKTNAAKEYVMKAASVMNGYTIPGDYDKLAEKYADNAQIIAILTPAMEKIGLLGVADDDTYEKIAPAKEIYNAYNSYLTTFAKGAALDDAEVKAILAKQTEELKKGYSDVETLKKNETEVNFLINKAIIVAQGGRTATEEAPVEITKLIVNPDFTSSASSGWSGNTGTSNEYARGNSEIWNVNPIDMYQVIKGLPAGRYEIKVRALYRDARNVADNKNQSWTSWWTDANGDVNTWARHYAELYAATATDTSAAYVKSVCDGKFTEPSFDRYYRAGNSDDFIEGDMYIDPETGQEIVPKDTIWTYAVPLDDMPEDEDGNLQTTRQEIKDELGTIIKAILPEGYYPFDEIITVDDNGVTKTYYYPSSMLGAYSRFQKSPEAYNNTITIEVKAGQDLRLGFRKNTSVSGDWLIFDDFQLFYLGGDLDETPIADAIANVEINAPKTNAIYNLRGQRVNSMSQKGIYISNGKKYIVK